MWTYRHKTEEGAALVTVLLFMMLTMILVVTMLAATGNEAAIAGFHRDSVRALDLAQAGTQEAIVRIQQGRPYTGTFMGSLNPNISVTSTVQAIGSMSAYREIQATATAGRATRHVSTLVLQEDLMFPPNIMLGGAILQPGNPNPILHGDVYSQTFVQYQSIPPDPGTLTYAGWRISLCNDPNCSGAGGGEVTFCYTAGGPNGCRNKGQTMWYPSSRRAEPASTAEGTDIQAQTNKCPSGGGGSLPLDQITGIAGTDPCPGGMCTTVTVARYGFDRDDTTVSGASIAPQAVNVSLPCGLPYRIDSIQFNQEDGTPVTRLFKTVVFEQWYANYWQFNDQQMRFVKGASLLSYPEFGAIPQVPNTTMAAANYNRTLLGGGTIPAGADWGCKYPEMSCSPAVSRPISVWLDNNSWTLNSALTGHGTIVIDGNLTIQQLPSDMEYWGTIIVKGTLTLANGNLIIHGGLVAKQLIVMNGNVTFHGGGTIGSVPVGPSRVVGKAWWEQ